MSVFLTNKSCSKAEFPFITQIQRKYSPFLHFYERIFLNNYIFMSEYCLNCRKKSHNNCYDLPNTNINWTIMLLFLFFFCKFKIFRPIYFIAYFHNLSLVFIIKKQAINFILCLCDHSICSNFIQKSPHISACFPHIFPQNI